MLGISLPPRSIFFILSQVLKFSHQHHSYREELDLVLSGDHILDTILAKQVYGCETGFTDANLELFVAELQVQPASKRLVSAILRVSNLLSLLWCAVGYPRLFLVEMNNIRVMALSLQPEGSTCDS